MINASDDRCTVIKIKEAINRAITSQNNVCEADLYSKRNWYFLQALLLDKVRPIMDISSLFRYTYTHISEITLWLQAQARHVERLSV